MSFATGDFDMPTMANKKPNLQILSDAETLARTCLQMLIDAVREAISSRGVFHLAISGGHTPKRFFELVATDPDSLSLPWEKIHLFWVDERCVPSDSPYSNYKLAADGFLGKVPIPKENVHRIPTEHKDFSAAAEAYEHTIRSVFNLKPGQLPEFDLIILGMGADGHTASLFPNCYACFDTDSIATVVYLLDQKLPDELLNRITLTHPVLCAARRLIILVSGQEKAEILKKVLDTPADDVSFPIHLLWPAIEQTVWLVDSPAAKLL